MSDKLMLRARHTQALKYCKSGTKKLIEKLGLDWDTFVHIGYSEEVALKTGDIRVIKAVEFARKEANRNG